MKLMNKTLAMCASALVLSLGIASISSSHANVALVANVAPVIKSAPVASAATGHRIVAIGVGFLLHNGGVELCGYNQNHVFDFASGETIVNGNDMGVLLMFAPDLVPS
jgi:hypothetical protein